MDDLHFIQNGHNPIWVMYHTATGEILGHIRFHEGLGYQMYVKSPVARVGSIPQGAPHQTLDAAKDDLRSFYR